MQIKKAVILSAGFGKRLNPITLSRPKPLLEINKKTLLENTISVLEKFGIEEIAINTHHLSHKIKLYINNKKFKANIYIVEESERILNTGGGTMNAAKNFNCDPFFVLNPDTIWSQAHLDDFKTMEKKYLNNNYKCVLLLVDKTKSFDKTLKGDFNLEDNIVNRDSEEKQYVYTGSQIINNSVFKDKILEPFSMNLIWNSLIKNNQLMGVKSTQEFLHVTDLTIYNKLIERRF